MTGAEHQMAERVVAVPAVLAPVASERRLRERPAWAAVAVVVSAL